MRILLALLGATALTACGGGGGGPETVGGTAAPTAPPVGGGNTGSSTDIYAQFTNPVEAKTYVGVGGSQVYKYITDSRRCCEQQAQAFAGNATSVRNSGISITYDPRDAIFTLTVQDERSGAATQTRFQDSAHRTNFGGATEPGWGSDNFARLPDGSTGNPNIRYLQAGDGNPISPYRYSGSGMIAPGNNSTPADGDPGAAYQSTILFYEVPGSTTKYVSFAGYIRNAFVWDAFPILNADGTPVLDANGNAALAQRQAWNLERGAFAYGAFTANSAVPTTGSASYTGSMLATVAYNPLFDTNTNAPTYFQWITGTSSHQVNFATLGLTSTFSGRVYEPQIDRYTSGVGGLPVNTLFTASSSATIDLQRTGGFVGKFNAASFTPPGGTKIDLNVAGSSIDGAFYGPAADEIGGGFRIVGGTPDQRIDILGAFTGKK